MSDTASSNDAQAAAAAALAAEELRAKRIANDQAEALNAQANATAAATLAKLKADNAAAADSTLSTRLGAAVPKLSDLGQGTVSLPAGAPFRGTETAASAIDSAARRLARKLVPSLTAGSLVLVTSDADIVQSLIQYFEVEVSVDSLHGAAIELLAQMGTVAPPTSPTPTRPAEHKHPNIRDTLRITSTDTTQRLFGGALLDAAPAVASAFKEVASLLVVDSTVDSNDSTLTEFETHVLVIGELLAACKLDNKTVKFVQDEARRLRSRGALLRKVEQLGTLSTELKSAAERVQAADPTGTSDADKEAAASAKKTVASAADIEANITEFLTRITTAPADGGESPLARAQSREELAQGSASFNQILIVPKATISTDQVAIKRRLLNPRVVVTAFAHLSFMLVDLADGHVLASGAASGSMAYRAKFGSWVSWSRQPSVEQTRSAVRWYQRKPKTPPIPPQTVAVGVPARHEQRSISA